MSLLLKVKTDFQYYVISANNYIIEKKNREGHLDGTVS